MASLLDRLPEGSRIAVIRLRSLGDCVLTTPALALLKQHRPDLQIGVVVEDRFRGVFADNPGIAQLVPPELGAIAAWRPQLTLNLHGGTRSMWLTAASRARIRAGFAHHAHSYLYNIKIPRAQEILSVDRPVHTAEHLASAMFWIGVTPTEIPRAQLFVSNAVAGAISHEPRPPGSGPSGSYAVLHPFASSAEKTWDAQSFLQLAQHLRDHLNLEPVILAGPSDDTTPFAGLRVYRNAPLSEVKQVIAGAQLFIGNDSGPAHIAAAFGIPVVVLFGASNPVTWAPWRTQAEVITEPRGMASIDTARVIAAATALRDALDSNRTSA